MREFIVKEIRGRRTNQRIRTAFVGSLVSVRKVEEYKERYWDRVGFRAKASTIIDFYGTSMLIPPKGKKYNPSKWVNFDLYDVIAEEVEQEEFDVD